MKQDSQQRTQSIEDLIRLIDEGNLLLPEFQRDFVWEVNQTYELFDSIIRDIFIGAIIYGSPSFDIAVRKVDDRKKKRGERKKPLEVFTITKEQARKEALTGNSIHLLLDGQQRVTSIYRALKGIDEVWVIFKNTDELNDTDYNEENLEYKVYEVTGKEDEQRLSVKLSDVWNIEKGDYDESEVKEKFFYQTAYFQYNDDLDEKEEFRRYRKAIKSISDLFKSAKLISYYLLDMSLDKFVAFFERSNTKGVQLNFIDILTAKLYTGNFNLRDKIEEFKNENKEYVILSEILVRTIAYFKSEGKEINRNYILDKLMADDFHANWDELCILYKKSIDFLYENHFIISQNWMPYDNMLLPIMIFLKEVGGDFHVMNSDQKEFFHYWYWASIFSLRYSGSSNERLIEDSNILKNIAKGKLVSNEEFFKKINKSLITSKEDVYSYDKSGNAIYRGIFNLIHYDCHGLLDWNNSNKLSLNSTLEDHHIFPKEYVRQFFKGEQYESVNCVANRALVPKILNIKIGKQKPSAYLNGLKNSNSELEQSLNSHLIDKTILEGLFDEEFEIFVDLRSEAIFGVINKHIIEKAPNIKHKFYKEMPFDEKTNIKIFAVYKKEKVEATLNLTTEKVFYKGELYDSPSAAAVAVLKDFGSTRDTENGWQFWKYVSDNDEVLKIKKLQLAKKRKQEEY